MGFVDPEFMSLSKALNPRLLPVFTAAHCSSMTTDGWKVTHRVKRVVTATFLPPRQEGTPVSWICHQHFLLLCHS